MPKANALPSTHRRNLFSGTVSVSLIASLGITAHAASSADTRLRSLTAQFWTLNKALDASALWPEPSTKAEVIEESEKLEELVDAIEAVTLKIAQCETSQHEGWQEKARIVQAILPDAIKVFSLTQKSAQIQLVMSLMNDLTKGQTS